MNIEAKILNKYGQTASNNTLERSYTMNNWDSSQGSRMVQYSQINKLIHHVNKRKDKNHMIISTNAEKAFDTI